MENDALPLYSNNQHVYPTAQISSTSPNPQLKALSKKLILTSGIHSIDILREIEQTDHLMIQKANAMNAPPPPASLAQPSSSMPAMHYMKPLLGPDNTVTVCQFCHASIKTAVKYTNTSRTHIAAALWGLLCCLCCVPYGAESAKNSDHYCPNCQRYLGTYVK